MKGGYCPHFPLESATKPMSCKEWINAEEYWEMLMTSDIFAGQILTIMSDVMALGHVSLSHLEIKVVPAHES